MDSVAYYVILGATYLFGLAVRQKLNATYAKYARVANRAGLNGAQVARDILDANGLGGVQLGVAPGKLSDHYDPRTRVIRLSSDIARNASVAALTYVAGAPSAAGFVLLIGFDFLRAVGRRPLASL